MTTPVYVKTPWQRTHFKAILTFLGFVFLGLAPLRSQVLTCPNDYTIQLPANLCTISINYDSLDWSSTIPLFDPVFFPFQGTFLPTGTTAVTLAATDANGNFHTCDFEVTIVAFNSTNFNCPSQVSVSLGGECEHVVTADDALNPNYTICNQDYSIEILNENNQWVDAVINATQVNQAFNLQVTNDKTGHSCQTIMVVSGGEPASITCPPNKNIFCNEPTDTSHIGGPILTGCFDAVDITFSDAFTASQCPDSIAFQIMRTFVAVSPNGSQTSCSHIITAKRFSVNAVQFPPDYDGVANPALACSDSLNLVQTTHPEITGWPEVANFPSNASTHCKLAITYVDQTTQLCGDSYRIKRAWSVVNLCNAQSRRDTQTIIVLDESPPLFEITDTLYFSLSGGCVDSVFLPSATLVSECSSYDFSMVTPWGNFTDNGVWVHPDTLPGDYYIDYNFVDDCGNDSTQTLLLRIMEESLVACPANDTISCDHYFSVISPAIQSNNFQVLATLGLPTFHQNCNFVISESDSVDVDACGNGLFIRTITANNQADTISCEQLVTVQHLSNFEASFPPDTSLCVTPAQANLPEPQLFSINCENVSVTFSDMIESAGSGGCYNVLRTWYATNACAYEGSQVGSDSLVSTRRFRDNGDGQISYTQVIHINNSAPVSFPNGCDIPDKYVNEIDCSANFLVPTPVVEGCGNQLLVTVSGSLGTTLGAPVSVLPGQYSVAYKVTDECGKMQTCSSTFEVFDTLAPLITCKNMLLIDLGQTCSVEVFASDLMLSATDNCDNNLTFSFEENSVVFVLSLGACEIGQQPYDVWATDEVGNVSHCQTNLIVQSTVGNCDCDPVLGGKIETDVGPDIKNVRVLIANPNDFVQAVYSNSTGDYLAGIVSGDDYIITPVLDTLPSNGVSTFDMVLIRRHILGSDTLDTPYKIIAADANNSGAVTTFDLVEIRKLILQINDDFPNNYAWRFVDAAYTFPNPLNPFQEAFPESIIVNEVTQDITNLDFIGIKIGDVNGSAITNFSGEQLQNKDE